MIDKCLDGTLTLKSIDDNQCKYVTQKADVASIMRSIGALPDLYYNNEKLSEFFQTPRKKMFLLELFKNITDFKSRRSVAL